MSQNRDFKGSKVDSIASNGFERVPACLESGRRHWHTAEGPAVKHSFFSLQTRMISLSMSLSR